MGEEKNQGWSQTQRVPSSKRDDAESLRTEVGELTLDPDSYLYSNLHFMIFCWVEQHPVPSASIPTPGAPSHSEEAGNRHYRSMARLQLGFAIQIRFCQFDALMPDLSGGSEVQTSCLLSLLLLQARKIMGIYNCGSPDECTSHFSTAGLASTQHPAAVL